MLSLVKVLKYGKMGVVALRIPMYLLVGMGAGSVAGAGLKIVESTLDNQNMLNRLATKTGVFALQSLVVHNATEHIDEMLTNAIDGMEKSIDIIESSNE